MTQGCHNQWPFDPPLMLTEIFNPNPTVFSTTKAQRRFELSPHSLWVGDDAQDEFEPDNSVEPIDQEEIFGNHLLYNLIYSALTLTFPDLIRSIYDPEHPNTLEELRVVSAPQIAIGSNHIKVEFTPTVPHCGMSTLIGPYSISYSLHKLVISIFRTLHSRSIAAKFTRTLQSGYCPQAWFTPERARRFVLDSGLDFTSSMIFQYSQ